jgi:SRSO17 transposase
MDRRAKACMEALLAECEVRPESLREVPAHLVKFIRPFQECLVGNAPRKHAVEYVQGLLSNVKRKNVESIAYQLDQDRRNLQHFIGTAPWDHVPLVDELCRQVGSELGESDGVLVIDPSAFPKCGKKSVGVARQWCGRLGKIDNCQVGVYLAYVSRREQALCDLRLYLPKVWTDDRKRCRAAGVPKPVRHCTRHELALEMILARRETLPHGWVTADDEFGKVGHFRRDLHDMGERYLLAVPHNLTVRILDGEEVPHRGAGEPKPRSFVRLDKIRCELPATAWSRIEVRDGEKGPLVVEVAVVPRVQAKAARRHMPYAEALVFIRYVDAHGTRHEDYYLSDAASDTAPAEFARVASAERRVEECFRRGKSETGMAHYEVRTWCGWHHHQVLSLIATWFMVQETRRGKKIDTSVESSATAADHCSTTPSRMEPNESRLDDQQRQSSIAA